jgi:tetratricopeptide (TPR) repeat protein
MLNRLLFMFMFVAGLLGQHLFAEDSGLQTQFDQALAQYDQGDYKSSTAAFESLILKRPGNGHLYYNLGNAYFRSNLRGKAMAAFLEARRLLPRDPDVKANIKFVSDGAADRLDTALPRSILASIAFWLDSATPRELAYICAWLFAAAGFFFLVQFLPKLQGATYLGLGFLGIAAIFAFALSVSVAQDQKWGAVASPVAKVTSGPGQGNAVVFELKEGAPFVAQKSENSWYQIELSDGKKGWLAASDAVVYGQQSL